MKAKSGWIKAIVAAFGLSAMLAAAGFVGESAAKEKKAPVELSKLPDVVKKAVEEAFPNGEIINIQQEAEGDNPGQYDVDIRSGGKEYEVEISPKGKVIENKEKAAEIKDKTGKQERKWTDSFGQENRTFSSVGKNRYFILVPGHQRVLKTRTDKLVITVLEDTKMVSGVETRVVEEREWEDGRLAEVSRNFFAVCNQTNDVFYFGEEVDIYKDGKIAGHGGAWLAGENGAVAGIIMPGTFLLGSRYYQEIAPGVAMDRGENAAMDLTIDTPAGQFNHCVKVIETSPLEHGSESIKVYCPGIGLIVDDEFKLVEVKEGASK